LILAAFPVFGLAPENSPKACADARTYQPVPDRSCQMNKSDLVDALADATGMTKADAGRAIDALFGTDDGIISSALQNEERVQITGFGTFEAKHRKARTGRNPRTGETIQIAATMTPGFRAGKGLKDALKS
jgi:DNA-binding protein HU-beta